MSRIPKAAEMSAGSFLPDDYLERKAERRALFISLGLFVLVVAGVIGGFFVTHRQWYAVKAQQQRINADYAAEAKKIDQLKILEKQKADMMQKADITTALIEKVPRSILMAELINRMPKQLTLTTFKMESKRVVEVAKPLAAPGASAIENRGHTDASSSAPPAPPKPPVPRFEFTIQLVGLALGDDEVADYHTALNQCALLSRVETISTSEQIVDEVALRQFRMELTISSTAEARNIKPVAVPRLAGMSAPAKPRDPMDPTAPRDDIAQEPVGVRTKSSPLSNSPAHSAAGSGRQE